MPIGMTFTKGGQFGVSNGPTYQGQETVPAVVLGTETYRNPTGQILNGGVGIVIDASGFLIANLLAFGVKMELDPVQTHVGGPTPAELAAAVVTIRLVNVVGGVGDFEIVLGVGQEFSQIITPAWLAANGITDDCTEINVDGDVVCDCDVYGLVLLSA